MAYKDANWHDVWGFIVEYNIDRNMDSATVAALCHYVRHNPVTIREIAIMLSVYALMSVDEVTRRMLALAA